MVTIATTRLGVPFAVDGDEIVPLSYPYALDLAALEAAEPGTINRLTWAVKEAVEQIAGLDASLPEHEWWAGFNNLLALNEFTTPLHVLAEARARAESIMGGNA